MAFSEERTAYNKYGEPIGVHNTCTVCGKTWIRSFRNDVSWMGQTACQEAMIEEWDGERNLVHYEIKQEDIVLVYQDGLTHKVTKAYFKKVVVHFYG